MIGLREESCFQCARMVPLRRAPFLNPHLVYLVVIVKLPYECIVPGPILLGMHLPLIPFGPCTNHARDRPRVSARLSGSRLAPLESSGRETNTEKGWFAFSSKHVEVSGLGESENEMPEAKLL